MSLLFFCLRVCSLQHALFITVRFILVSESLKGPFINQMSQRHTLYSKQTLVGRHDAFYS